MNQEKKYPNKNTIETMEYINKCDALEEQNGIKTIKRSLFGGCAYYVSVKSDELCNHIQQVIKLTNHDLTYNDLGLGNKILKGDVIEGGLTYFAFHDGNVIFGFDSCSRYCNADWDKELEKLKLYVQSLLKDIK